jgi:predicted metal-dependent hydrolase
VGDQVEVRRSTRRRSTVSAYRDNGRIIVAIPARFTPGQEREWVRRMVARLGVKEGRRRPSDAQLEARAADLSARYLGGRAVASSVQWSAHQGRRWGSCSLPEGAIRISTRVRGMPSWVLDYVLLHELAHLLHPGHGPGFWALLAAYPRTERARGFLEGAAFRQDSADNADTDNGDTADADGPR